ncbi:MAG: alanine:cation symporter family protein [Spirochaetaceae bacterium]|jgi:AGCS family alanine or glycine:cation symporter|nr:alanine:cation symporter family protein [Spirochaetaceae bacterium]
MEQFANIVSTIDGWLWGPWVLVWILPLTHVFMTVRTGFIQKKLLLGIKLSVTKDADGTGDVSQFGALTTALAATIGTGNIIGVGTAIARGGPGAVLWMWLMGVFGIATKYAESLIAVKYRVRTEDGTMLGGAMYALERGLKMKWLGVLFAVFAALASFGIGNGVQANAVATLLNETAPISITLTGIVNGDLGRSSVEIPIYITQLVAGAVMAVLVGMVILGGIKSISKVCIALVPFMALFYVFGCIVILVINHSYIFPAIALICKSAFSSDAATGGFVGFALSKAIQFGFSRGLFSNESGMGSAPIVAAAAKTRNPVRQALVSSTGTFWDTVLICLITGIVIISTVLAHPEINTGVVNGATLTHNAFMQITGFGPFVLTVALIVFAFSTILGWSYYGERCVAYLFGSKIIRNYRIIFVLVVFIGAIAPLDLAWNISDILNGLMTLPNIIAMILLSGVIAKETKKYLNNIDAIDADAIPLRTELIVKSKKGISSKE